MRRELTPRAYGLSNFCLLWWLKPSGRRIHELEQRQRVPDHGDWRMSTVYSGATPATGSSTTRNDPPTVESISSSSATMNRGGLRYDDLTAFTQHCQASNTHVLSQVFFRCYSPMQIGGSPTLICCEAWQTRLDPMKYPYNHAHCHRGTRLRSCLVN